MHIVLVNPYELGRQSFGLAHATAWLKADGHTVECIDLAHSKLEEGQFAKAEVVAIQLAMHTATRIAEQAFVRIQQWAPNATLVAFGLYAHVNAEWLRTLGVEHAFGGEFEEDLRALIAVLSGIDAQSVRSNKPQFVVPDRTGLPALERHARLQLNDGRELTMGFAETTRGCKHVCRHCPVVPVYGGKFRAIPQDVVMQDIRQQVAAGAQHISFGDPDFLHGPTHALRIARAIKAEFPKLTFDAVVKVEHLLAQQANLAELAECGLRLVISAVESVDDRVLGILDKGHTREDFETVTKLMRDVGIAFSPTFVAFTPWTTLQSYRDLLRVIAKLDLVDSVAPVQLAIRLLVPNGSYLLQAPETEGKLKAYDPAALGYPWDNDDPRVDSLQQTVWAIAEKADSEDAPRSATFKQIWQATHDALGETAPPITIVALANRPPRHSENWYCCAEPTSEQMMGW